MKADQIVVADRLVPFIAQLREYVEKDGWPWESDRELAEDAADYLNLERVAERGYLPGDHAAWFYGDETCWLAGDVESREDLYRMKGEA